MKNRLVELIVGNRRETFERFHATRLLLMRNNGGWKLPEDTDFTFSRKDGIRLKAVKKNETKPRADKRSTRDKKEKPDNK